MPAGAAEQVFEGRGAWVAGVSSSSTRGAREGHLDGATPEELRYAFGKRTVFTGAARVDATTGNPLFNDLPTVAPYTTARPTQQPPIFLTGANWQDANNNRKSVIYVLVGVHLGFGGAAEPATEKRSKGQCTGVRPHYMYG